MMYTTCSINDGSPGRSGTARGTTLRAAGAACGTPRVTRLLRATDVVYAASSASPGPAMTFTDPRSEWTYLPSIPDVRPVPDPTPNSVPTASVRPSALTSRLDGYHPVGIRPRNCPPGSAYTPTALSPPSVTYCVAPSGETSTSVGANQILRSRNGAMAIDRSRVRARVSMTLTVSELPLATYNRPFFSSQATPVGCRPTVITVRTAPATRSTSETSPAWAMPRASTRTSSANASQHCLAARERDVGFRPPRFVTQALEPSALIAAATGSTPSGISLISETLSASITASEPLAGSGTTATRRPVALARAATATPPAISLPSVHVWRAAPLESKENVLPTPDTIARPVTGSIATPWTPARFSSRALARIAWSR